MNRHAKRSSVYHDFKEFVQHNDSRTMDEICISDDTFRLQAQQEFLRSYMRKHPHWRQLLLYHQIGSGKTCTSITMAEEWLKTYGSLPGAKVKVILPARLKTNFLDELISPCGMEHYISKIDFVAYNSPSTSKAKKTRIRTKFMAAINAKYDVMSFEKLKLVAIKNKTRMKEWIEEFTHNSMIVVDEVHNLLSSVYDKAIWEELAAMGRIAKTGKGMNTIIFKALNKFADKGEATKMVYLTATPIFDNIMQLAELATVMNPEAVIPPKPKISQITELLRGKVSYFPGTSKNAYPKMEYKEHYIQMSKTQDAEIMNVQMIPPGNPGSDAYMSAERQISLACLPSNTPIKDNNIHKVIDNLEEYSPKIVQLLDLIVNNNLPGKHFVYTNFVQSGINVVKEALLKQGWVDFDTIKETEVAGKKKNAKKEAAKQGLVPYLKQRQNVFAIWDGSVKDADKQLIKSVVNSTENINGDLIRVIIGSPSVKEGVSFKHVQHMHMLDPVWNQSAKTQVEGRVSRFCSHVDIPIPNTSHLERKVVVHIYRLTRRDGGMVMGTADDKFYDIIIPSKEQYVTKGEAALKKVAIDHFLFRNLYASHSHNDSPADVSAASEIGVVDDVMKGKNNKKYATSCPKKRRPNEYMACDRGYTVKLNPQGYPCCYKKKKGAPDTPPPPPSPPSPAHDSASSTRRRAPPPPGPQGPPRPQSSAYDGPPMQFFTNEFDTVFKKDGPDGAKRAYRKMTLLYHPDKHQKEAKKYEAIFKVFQQAWAAFKLRHRIVGGDC